MVRYTSPISDGDLMPIYFFHLTGLVDADNTSIVTVSDGNLQSCVPILEVTDYTIDIPTFYPNDTDILLHVFISASSDMVCQDPHMEAYIFVPCVTDVTGGDVWYGCEQVNSSVEQNGVVDCQFKCPIVGYYDKLKVRTNPLMWGKALQMCDIEIAGKH